MWIVLGVVVLVVVAVVAIVAMRRPRGDDLHSVQSYHSALGTLETFADRTGQSPPEVVAQADRSGDGHVRPRFYSRATADAAADPAAPDGSPVDPGDVDRGGRTSAPHSGMPPSIPPLPVRGNADFPDPGAPLRFDDAPPVDHRRQEAGPPGPGLRMDRAQRHALDSMNHRPRRITTVMIVVAALVLFGVLAYVGSRRTGSTGHGHAVATATTTGGSTTSQPSTKKHSGGGATKHEHKASTTTTTLPKQIVALTSTPTSATYPVATSAYKVTLSTSGPCWVQAITVETGSTLWEGTLQAGQVQVIPASGPVTVELGAPAATLKIDNIPVVLPVPLHTPFVARFQPSSPAATGSASTTTTVPSFTANGSVSSTTIAGGPGV
jgi:hypothetical protein